MTTAEIWRKFFLLSLAWFNRELLFTLDGWPNINFVTVRGQVTITCNNSVATPTNIYNKCVGRYEISCLIFYGAGWEQVVVKFHIENFHGC